MENMYREKDEIWLSPMTKARIPTVNSTTHCQHKKSTKNLDYTTIADRLEVTAAIQIVWLSRFTGTQPSY